MTDDPRRTASPPVPIRADLAREYLRRLHLARAVAAAERRRGRHRVVASRRKLALVVVGAVLALPVLAAVLRGAYDVGASVGSGELRQLLELARWYLPVPVGLYLLVGLVQSDSSVLEFGARELHLTTVPDRPLAVGLLLADVRSWVVVFVGPLALVVAAFAAGAGSVTVAVVGTAAAALLLLAVLLWGYTLGLVGRVLWRRYLHVRVSRTLLQTLGMVGLGLAFGVGGVFVGSLSAKLEGGLSIEALAPAGEPPVPLGSYAELFFVGTPLVASPSWTAIGSVVVVAGSLPLAVGVVALAAPRLWYADPAPAPATDADREKTSATGGTGRTWAWERVPTAYVAHGVLRRAVRVPERLTHLAYYVLVVGILVAGSLVDPSVLFRQAGWAAVLFGLWLAGGVVGLNPIGDEGAMLSQLVLSRYSPRTFVRARLLAGTVVGVPLVGLGAALLVVHGVPVLTATAAGLVWLGLLPVSAAIAVGLGTLLPRTRPGDAIDVQAPESLAVFVHGGVTAVLATTGWRLVTDTGWLPHTWVGTAMFGFGAVLAADVGYRFGVSGVADYGRPDPSGAVYALELATCLGFLGLLLSVTLPAGLAVVLDETGRVASIAFPAAASLGWALAAGAYLLASGRPWDRPTGRPIARGDAVPAGIGVVTAGVAALALGRIGLDADSFVAATATVPLDSLGGFVSLGVGLALWYALSTEFLFRRVLQQRLATVFPGRWPLLATAGIFAAVHLPLAVGAGGTRLATGVGALFCLAAIWGWVYDRSGSVLLPALCHACFGAVLLVT